MICINFKDRLFVYCLLFCLIGLGMYARSPTRSAGQTAHLPRLRVDNSPLPARLANLQVGYSVEAHTLCSAIFQRRVQ
jgi:hypothetical protein